MQRIASNLPRWLIGLFLIALAYSTVFPFINEAAVSFSSSRAINSGEVFMWPIEFNTAAYRNLIRDGQLLTAMKNTVWLTVVGTFFNMVFTTLAAYPLAKRKLQGRNLLLSGILFTMLFGGGLIPNFLLVKSLGLINTYWALWLPGLIGTYNMFVLKSFFEGLPSELEESAEIDGANELTVLWKIILPLSMPVLAALTLFYAVGWWNSFFNVLIYIKSTDKMSVGVKLAQMLGDLSSNLLEGRNGEGVSQEVITPQSVQAAATMLVVLPILCVYPFLQKYFVKGVLLGSVKG